MDTFTSQRHLRYRQLPTRSVCLPSLTTPGATGELAVCESGFRINQYDALVTDLETQVNGYLVIEHELAADDVVEYRIATPVKNGEGEARSSIASAVFIATGWSWTESPLPRSRLCRSTLKRNIKMICRVASTSCEAQRV